MSGDSPPYPEPRAPQPDAERILIVRPTALGDVARTVPALATLRAAFPRAKIDWLVHTAFADAVRHHPMLDGVVPFDRKALGGFGLKPRATRAGLALAKRLRRAGYTRVYDLQGLARSGLLTWLTRAPRRVGFADARERGWLGYNVRHRVPAELHTVDRMLRLLGGDKMGAIDDMRLYVGADDAAWAAAYRAEHGLTHGRTVMLAPTAQWGCKCWPIEKYAEIAWRVKTHGSVDKRVVLLAAPHEHDKLRPITERLGDRALVPTTTVGQLMALIEGAAALVANDSAALHLAVGLGRPVVALFGPTDPALVGPYQRKEDVLQPESITPEDMAHYRTHKDDNALISRIETNVVYEKLYFRLPA